MNTVTAAPQIENRRESAADAVMERGRVLRAYLTEAKYELLRMLRLPAFAGPFLILPVGLYLLFGYVLFGAAIANDPKAALFIFMGFSIMGVMGPGMFGFGTTIATEREHGLLRLKRALPVPPAATLLGKMLMSMLFVAIIMVTMAAAAPLVHLHLPAGRLIALSAVCILGCLPFCALGFFIGSLSSSKAAPGVVNLFYLPMIYLSGILFPMPKSAEWLPYFSPAYHLDQVATATIGAPSAGNPAVHIAVLAAVTIAFTALAVRRLARKG
jgi:ABC-2 type transport system permease protein